MNTLLRLLTAKGSGLYISLGLDGVDQFNNMGAVDGLIMLAKSTGDMQVLLDEIQKFEAWNGHSVKRVETCALIVKDVKHVTCRRNGMSYTVRHGEIGTG